MQASDEIIWKFLLFVSKTNQKTDYMITQLEKFCEKHLKDRYTIDVIDVVLDPEATMKEDVIATPTLLKKFPEPSKKIIGDLSDEKKLLAALEILQE